MDPIIVCEKIGKSYRRYEKAPGLWGSVRSFWHRRFIPVAAVKDFSMQVPAGQIVGLLGPNGAGKTTLMKLLSGLVAPSAGQARVMGLEPFERASGFRKNIALVMGQKSQLWWDIPALDSLHLIKSYYEIPRSDFDRRLEELGDALGVRGLLTTQVRRLSLGERMKMELMACLLHEPKVLFLDEPTIGLDVVAQKGIREFLRGYQRRHGTTVILTSHYMADVEALCSRIVLILGGTKRFDGPKEKFERLLGQEKIVSVSFEHPVDRDHRVWHGLYPVWHESGMQVEVRIDETELRSRTAAILAEFPVSDFSTQILPVERVMEELLRKPELMPGQA